MYQWIDIAIAWDVDNGGGDANLLQYSLFPVEVKQGESALRYTLHQKAPALSRSSEDHVTIGSFGMYNLRVWAIASMAIPRSIFVHPFQY